MKTVAFYTLGCKVNQYETEAMMELFQKHHYKVQDFSEKSDLYIINTCTVTNQSDRKSRQMISRARKNNGDAIIAVVGCYPQVSPEEVEKIEGVDLIVGTADRNKIVEYCERAMGSDGVFNEVEDSDDHQIFEELVIENQSHMTRAYIKIQEGCRMFCSYCIIPYARGPLKSRPIKEIQKEAQKLAKNGYQEIILTGIHVASYGLDLGKERLIDVIETVANIDGIERVRLSSLEPRHISPEFLRRMKETKKACDHFHLSLQSGSDFILQQMNRKYDRKLFLEKVQLIREYFPNAGITTDIIVGFPGEKEEDFEQTLDLVKKVHFSKIHVFKYSPRKGTKAAQMKNQINGRIKKERSNRLIEAGKIETKQFLEKYCHYPLEVLWEERSEDGHMEGYTTNYIRIRGPYDKNKTNKIEEVIAHKIDGEVLVL
ncbi:MAG: tRNA (N(6)-L-threonylcarbamoyladenosine(37)-C(2))-methylthiotransferase MtaB [Tissierellia bacterium]|nr:tRNA (N(6)-L-threonylcarbamoyladenosine(37)-C(2))-methylthiotransferase MtaB [Tissierellia bacterium]